MAKTKKNQFNSVTPFSKFLAMVLFILLPILGFYLGGQVEKLNQQRERIVHTNTNIESSSSTTKEVNNFGTLNIEDHISYSLPKNWQLMQKRVDHYLTTIDTKDLGYSAHYIEFTSKNGTATPKIIHIEVMKKEMRNEDYMSIEKLNNGYSNTGKVIIDNVKAIRFNYDDNQGHFLMYRFIHLNLHWNIWIQTTDIESEKAYQKDIDSFIKSIKLLEK